MPGDYDGDGEVSYEESRLYLMENYHDSFLPTYIKRPDGKMIEVEISADSQEEFDLKRADLVKAIAGISPIAPRRAFHQFQNDMMDYYNARFEMYIDQIKADPAKLSGIGMELER